MLLCKKDGCLCFYIDFCKFNMRTKKDFYPLPWIQEAIECLVGAGYFSCMNFKAGFWQTAMDEASKQYTTFIVGNIGLFEYEHKLFRLCNAPAMFLRPMQKCLDVLNLTYCFDLPGWCDCLFKNGRGTLTLPSCCVWMLLRAQSDVQANQAWILHKWNQLFGSSWLQGRCTTQQGEPWMLWQNLLHHKPTLKPEPFWAWWDIIGSLLMGSHALCNHCMSICLEKVPVRRMSM